MNENIDLTKILEGCPKGTELYSTIYGKVRFEGISNSDFCPIEIKFLNKFTNPSLVSAFLQKTADVVLVMMENVPYFPLKTSEVGQSLKDSGISRRLKSLTQRLCIRLTKFLQDVMILINGV